MHVRRRGRTVVAIVALVVPAVGLTANCHGWSDGIVLTGEGTPIATAVASGALIVGGYDSLPGNGEWRIERRALDTGTLDPGFDGDGIASSDPTFNWDVVNDVCVDTTSVYAVGFDGAPGDAPGRWRIEKRRLDDGGLDPGFGTGGVITVDPAELAGPANAVTMDGGDLLVAGRPWRIERRRAADGSLVPSFGTSGAVISTSGEANAVAVAGGALYVAGSSDLGGWRLERRDPVTGALVWDVVEDFPDVGCGAQGVFDVRTDAAGVYLVGEAHGQWRVEKRSLSDGGLLYSYALPETGSCDAARGIAIDDSAMYVAGSHGHSSRLEKRLLSDGQLVPGFGTDGVVAGPFVDPASPEDVVLDGGLVYVVSSQFGPVAGSAGRIERRSVFDGTIVPDTIPPCQPFGSSVCRTHVHVARRASARDRLRVHCEGPLDARVHPDETIRLAVADGGSPPCASPCFADTVRPRRVGRCWVSSQKDAAGLRRLKLCDVKGAPGAFTLSARGAGVSLRCLDASPPYDVTLTIGNSCSTRCTASTTTTTTTSTTTTTTLAGGCQSVSALPAIVSNVPPNTEDWLFPEEARAADHKTAFVRLSSNPSSYLEATGFGFDLPPTARIDGITLTLVRAARDPGSIVDDAIRLVKAGTILDADRSLSDDWTPLYAAVDHGGPTDLWGTTWTAADVNSPSFGAAVRARYLVVAGNNDAGVDAMRITVDYCD